MVLAFCSWLVPGAEAPAAKRATASVDKVAASGEFAVRFHCRTPVGLGFRPAQDALGYDCVVSDVLPDSQAAAHNAQLGTAGGGRRLLANLSRVHRVSGRDVAGLPYARVLQR